MQEIIIIIIGIVVAFIIGWRLYKFFTKKTDNQSACAGCDADCALRDIQKKDCDSDVKNKNNNKLKPH